MSVVRLEVARREQFAGGHAFGAVGAYERIDGRLHLAVDPTPAQNAVIVDLDKAPRQADGRVHFSADICVLQPVDAHKANGTLLLEIPNRGRKGATGRFNRPAPTGKELRGTRGIGVGDGLLMNLGWTVVWIGWQWDVIRTLTPQGLMGFDAPQALGGDGQPIRGQVQLQWQLDAPAPDKRLSDRVHQTYAAAALDQPDAVLGERAHPGAERRVIARDRWRFARVENGSVVADDEHVTLEGGFQPGVLYDLVYETRVCPVVGAGMLALRDGLSFLRHGTAEEGNPCAGRIERTIGFGSSQVGRMLRGYLPAGMNTDEAGRRVMDGVLINVAGARRGEFNHRYAQPSVITLPSFGYQPPFRFEGFPGGTKVMAANSSSEYWNREASLLHIDQSGERDLDAPANVRIYHYAGTKHGAGTLRSEDDDEAAPAPTADGPIANVVDRRPLLRAALFHLERWIVDGTEPPSSRHPRMDDGTAVPPEEALGWFQRLPGVRVPEPEKLYRRRPLDLGPEAERGVGRYPAREHGEPYRWLVAALDEDGNERAGIRLPDVSVPVATHTGWMARRPRTGGDGQNVDMQGLTIPFAPDEAARRKRNDPRPSLSERYADEAAYEARAREATATLVKEGYLLADDLELVVQNALERFRVFARRQLAD